MNALRWLQDIKKIYGICPCCGEVFRLADAVIYTREPPPKTAFDLLRESNERHESAVARFEMQREAILEVERDRGAAAAHEQLVRIAPDFVGRGIDPEDVKVIYDPVRYIVFRGLDASNITGIEFIDAEPTSSERERLLRSLDATIKAGNVAWATWRITEDGRVVVERVVH